MLNLLLTCTPILAAIIWNRSYLSVAVVLSIIYITHDLIFGCTAKIGNGEAYYLIIAFSSTVFCFVFKELALPHFANIMMSVFCAIFAKYFSPPAEFLFGGVQVFWYVFLVLQIWAIAYAGDNVGGSSRAIKRFFRQFSFLARDRINSNIKRKGDL